jgi:hypothetical protein
MNLAKREVQTNINSSIEKNKNAIIVKKQINIENPWIKVNYRKQWSQEQFWIQKKNNSFKISTLKPNNSLSKNQFLLCQMNIPKSIKHTSFVSLQTNEAPCTINENRTYQLTFGLNKIVNTKYNRFFNSNNQTGLAIKIQNWTDEILAQYEEAELIQIKLIYYRNFEETYDEDYDYQECQFYYWVRFTIKIKHKFTVRRSINYSGSSSSRILEELNQKWIFYKKDYFRVTKGVFKGKISWKTIEKEVYDRENALEEIEIVDEEQLFE